MSSGILVAIDQRGSFLAAATVRRRGTDVHVERALAVHVRPDQRAATLSRVVAELGHPRMGVASLNAEEFATSVLELPAGVRPGDYTSAARVHGDDMPLHNASERIVRYRRLKGKRLHVGVADARSVNAIEDDLRRAGLAPCAIVDPGAAWLHQLAPTGIIDDAGEHPVVVCPLRDGGYLTQPLPELRTEHDAVIALRGAITNAIGAGAQARSLAYFGDHSATRFQAIADGLATIGTDVTPLVVNEKICPPYAYALALALYGVSLVT